MSVSPLPEASSSDSLHTANFELGPQAVSAYSRLNYTVWYALAEFVDNSTQSRTNYGNIIDDVLKAEDKQLTVDINYNREGRYITVEDNSIGMTRDKLIAALRVGFPTVDSKGRSRYGMGMKTAACWLGSLWRVTTCQWSTGEEWSAQIDVDAIAKGNPKIPLSVRPVSSDSHYTKIRIENLHRGIQVRTEDVIKTYLGAMYRQDIRNKKLILLFNNNPVNLPEEHEFATAEDGKEAKEEFTTTIGGHPVKGWFGVLKKGSRRLGGFSLIQNERQIRGYPDAWKPKSIFGGEDDEGGNSLVSQRLIGEITLNEFEVSHTKDEILYRDDEEEQLESYLLQATKRLKQFASEMRKGTKGSPWSVQKYKDLLNDVKSEFTSTEVKDTLKTAQLPPLSVISASIKMQALAVKPEEKLVEMDLGEMKVQICLQDRSDNDPYVTFYADADKHLMIIINQQHPYYYVTDNTERVDEITKQYVFDGVAEYMVMLKLSRVERDSVRRYKDQLLRAVVTRMENESRTQEEHAQDSLEKSLRTPPNGQPPSAANA